MKAIMNSKISAVLFYFIYYRYFLEQAFKTVLIDVALIDNATTVFFPALVTY